MPFIPLLFTAVMQVGTLMRPFCVVSDGNDMTVPQYHDNVQLVGYELLQAPLPAIAHYRIDIRWIEE